MNQGVWTDEVIERFFAYADYAGHGRYRQYFSDVSGDKVLKYIRPHLRGGVKEVLDYGCGMGYLDKHLLEQGYRVTAMDFTKASVTEVSKKYKNTDNFRGCYYFPEFDEMCAKKQKKFDAVFIFEVIEHLSDYYLENLMENLRKYCKKGGYVVITTPNEQDLWQDMVYCPFCDTEFNRIQHVRSWSSQTLAEFLEKNMFEVIFMEAVTVGDLFSGIDVKIKNMARAAWKKLKYHQNLEIPPNLICVARYHP